MSAPDPLDAGRCEQRAGCITCADEGIPMRVVAPGESAGLAWCVDEAGGRSEVMTALVEPVTVGDVVLVHAGTALARLPVASGGTS